MRRVRIVERPGETTPTPLSTERPARFRYNWLTGLGSLLCANGWGGQFTMRHAQTNRAKSGSESVNATALIADAEWAGPPIIPAQGHAREIVPWRHSPPGAADQGHAAERANRPDRKVVNFCDFHLESPASRERRCGCVALNARAATGLARYLTSSLASVRIENEIAQRRFEDSHTVEAQRKIRQSVVQTQVTI
jgi:hypothetical protein